MREQSLPLDEPSVGEKEIEYVTEAIRSGWLSWQGKYVGTFEEQFAKYCGVKKAISVSTGTAALILALQAAGIGPKDEVIVPTLTFSAAAFTVSFLGAKVVFADCENDRMVMDPSDVETRITSRTKAIMPVHLYGRPVDMDPIMKIARTKKVIVIEDVAEAVGAIYKGRKVGSIGDIGCFSFHNKLIATGEGGMVTTSNNNFAEAVMALKTPAPNNFTDSRLLSLNYRMSNITAAIGTAQLERLEEIIQRKRNLAQKYTNLLKNCPGITIIPEVPGCRDVYWRYTILVNNDHRLGRDKLFYALNELGIGARSIFWPMHLHPYYITRPPTKFESAENLSARGIDLPSSANLTDEQIDFVAKSILKIST